jgi:hypothetical protein
LLSEIKNTVKQQILWILILMKKQQIRSTPQSEARRTERFLKLVAVGTEGQTADIFINSKPINSTDFYFDEEGRNWN